VRLQLTEEQDKLRKKVNDFARQEIAPFIKRMEDHDEFTLEIVRKMGALGLMGIPIPEQWGGVGSDFTSYILVVNEISKVSATVGVILSVHTSVGTNPIFYFGNDEQIIKYIPKLATGAYLGAFALTEPNSGSDSASISTTAVKHGDRYILNGSKMFITNGGYADVYIAFAVTDSTMGARGISAFIVEKDIPGLFVGKREKKMGLNGSSTSELIFANAEVPAENLLGQEGEGFKIALSNLDAGRIGIAAQALGIAEAALECSIHYAKIHRQPGNPIGAHQAIPFKLADMATQIEAAKLLVYQAADLRSRGMKCTKEASMAKRFSTDTAMEAAIEAVQIHGGYDYSQEYPVDRLFRDAKATQIYEGTNEIQRIVIAKYLLGNEMMG
jgi:alkylation response protein AidB-like acyl-CoA dehydrogenase